MTAEGRLVLTGFLPARENMAIDEALARLSPVPAFRYYGWRPTAVSIGFFQRIAREVDLDKAEEAGVEVVRRVTGGGAVYHDERGEVTYSISLPDDPSAVPRDIVESYRLLCGGVIRGLARIGVQGAFSPINDIVVGGRKVSGNAQTRRWGKVLQHGTVLMRVDTASMFSILKVPDEKLRDKLAKAADERVTSLERVGATTDFERAGEALVRGFEETLGMRFAPSGLTDEERGLAEELARDKYGSRGWNHQR